MSTKERYRYSELPTEPVSGHRNMTSVETEDIESSPTKYVTLRLDTETGGAGGEVPEDTGIQSNIPLDVGVTEASDEFKNTTIQKLYNWYKGIFVGSITDSEVAGMIGAYGMPLKTFRGHRKFHFVVIITFYHVQPTEIKFCLVEQHINTRSWPTFGTVPVSYYLHSQLRGIHL